MEKTERRKELAKEAAKLVKEFKKVEEEISENTLQSIRIDKDGSALLIKDENMGNLKYGIDFVSSIIGFRVNGFGPCGSDFHSAIEEKRIAVKEKYTELSKKEFINSMGNLYYIECRCEEIYKRLQEIEREAACL